LWAADLVVSGSPPLPVEEVAENRADRIARAMGVEGDLVAARFARGCRCFAVWIDGAVGGYGWLSLHPEWIGELQLDINPRSNEGYIWNCVTLHEHRRKGIFSSLLIGVSSVARQEGLRRLWIGSVAIPAEKAVGPSGFEPALTFDSFRLAGIHCMRVQAAPAASPALVNDACEVLSTRPGWHVRRSQHRVH
jgi:GNAT superfamily N-acetyltransferase